MSKQGVSTVVTVAIIGIVAMVCVVTVGAVADDSNQEYWSASENWCDERGGELYNARAIWHGGLHCDLPNGTVVHMADVVDTGGESA